MDKKEFNKLQNVKFKNVIIKNNKVSGSFEGEIVEKSKSNKLTLEAISNVIDQKISPIYQRLDKIDERLDKVEETLEKHSKILEKHSKILEKHDKQFEKVFDILERNNLK
ncbi:MAG: hypothetical protein ACRDBR_01555 [Metamycoplasmataceae bacterium]